MILYRLRWMMESVKNKVNSSYMYTFVYCRYCNLTLFI